MAAPYHHGDLRAALLRAAVDVIAEGGSARMSLRDVARRAGVSHTAAGYHFGDRAGLLTAVATEGYRLLADALEEAMADGTFLDVGVRYVRFAVEHPAHFEVMYEPRRHSPDDEALAAAKRRTAAVLYGTEAAEPGDVLEGIAAWSLVHGLVTLWRNGNLPPGLGDDPARIARKVAPYLRTSRTGDP